MRIFFFFFPLVRAIIKWQLPLEPVKINILTCQICARHGENVKLLLAKNESCLTKGRAVGCFSHKELKHAAVVCRPHFYFEGVISSSPPAAFQSRCSSRSVASASFKAPVGRLGNRCVWGAVIDCDPQSECASIHAVGVLNAEKMTGTSRQESNL